MMLTHIRKTKEMTTRSSAKAKTKDSELSSSSPPPPSSSSAAAAACATDKGSAFNWTPTTNTRIVCCKNARSCSKSSRVIPYLPFDIIFKILLFLPAETLYEVMRFVSRDWYDSIHNPFFISAHRSLTPNGLLVESTSDLKDSFFLEMSGCELKWRNNIFQSFDDDHFKLVAGFDGLLLLHKYSSICEEYSYNNLVVVNPVMKQLVKLPPLNASPIIRSYDSTLGYATVTGAYKVVSCQNVTTSPVELCPVRILTIGVDQSWRLIYAKLMPVRRFSLDPVLTTKPLFINGFIYWASSSYIRCLDVDSELFHIFDVPKGYEWKISRFLPMEGLLAMLSSPIGLKWEVWVCKRVIEGEWTRLPDIDLECYTFLNKYFHEDGYCALRPVGWLNGGSYLVIKVVDREQKACIVQNVKTREISWVPLDFHFPWSVFCFPHTPSLVSIWPC